eukprot:2364279-Rhodomonas_salina.1
MSGSDVARADVSGHHRCWPGRMLKDRQLLSCRSTGLLRTAPLSVPLPSAPCKLSVVSSLRFSEILANHRAANASQTFSSILSSVRRRVEGGTPTYRIVLANEERTLVAVWKHTLAPSSVLSESGVESHWHRDLFSFTGATRRQIIWRMRTETGLSCKIASFRELTLAHYALLYSALPCSALLLPLSRLVALSPVLFMHLKLHLFSPAPSCNVYNPLLAIILTPPCLRRQVQMSSAYYEDSMSITAGLFFASNAFQSPCHTKFCMVSWYDMRVASHYIMPAVSCCVLCVAVETHQQESHAVCA